MTYAVLTFPRPRVLRLLELTDALHILEAFVPISASQAAKQGQKGELAGTMAQQFFGMTRAPYHMRLTAEEQWKAEAQRKVEATPLQKRSRAFQP